MKRFTFILCFVACALAACQKETPIDDVNPIGTYVTATVGSDLTKTVLGEKDGASWPVLWQTGDKIDINGNESAPLAEGGQATAVFSFDALLEAPYKAAYPASVMTGVGVGELPAVQNYTADSFDAAAGVLLGTGDSEGVTFSHAMAYIAFVPVKGELDADIKSLELTATGSEKLSGTFTTDYSALTLSDEASSKVTVNCTEAVALENEIVVAIPAQTYSQGFTVKLTDNAGNSMQKSTGASWTAEAGHIYTTSLTYVPDEVEPTLPETIYLAGDAFEWGWDATKLESENGIFEITADLDLSWENETGQGFKIFADNNGETNWDVAYGMCPGSTKEDISFDLMSNLEGNDPQFYLKPLGFTTGSYIISIDFNTMKMSLTLVEPFYVFGSGLDCGDWTFDEAYALNPLGDDIYEGHDIHLYNTSYFKFDRRDWTEYRRDASASDYWTVVLKTSETDPDNGFYAGDDPGFKNGKYTVRLDLNTMKVTLTLTEADPEGAVTYIYLHGAAFADYADWADWISVPSVGKDIYETTLNLNVGDSSYARGFKIYKAKEDWSNEYCMFTDSTHDNIKFGHINDTGNNQVTPFNVGYTESGNYVVRIDFNTMTITFTKE